ncbi:MAG: hypothetical protein ACRC40_00545 [Fusobacteriaceae bacterium]
MNIQKLFALLLIFLMGCSSVETTKREREGFSECYIGEGVPKFLEKERSSIPYFFRVDDGSKKITGSRCEEKRYLELFKDKKAKGVGDNSPYWRWEVELSKTDMEALLNKNIYSLKRGNSSSV